MELRHMRTFVEVVRRGTLIAAARALGCSQATVTLHVQELERACGARLFDRIGKSVVITEAGRRAHARALLLLEAIDEMKRDVAAAHAGNTGLVRVGAIEPTASARLPPVLRGLAQAHQGITVRLEIGGTGTIASRVASADLDVGIATTPPRPHELDFEPLFDEPLVLVLPAGDAGRRGLKARDVAGMSVLLTEDGCAYRKLIEDAFGRVGERLRVHQEIGSTAAILACVRAGMGVGFVPARAVPAHDASLAVRHLADLPLTIPVGLVLRRRTGGPASLVSIVCDRLRQELREAGAPSRGALHPRRPARRA